MKLTARESAKLYEARRIAREATAREACAKLADEISDAAFAIFKGRSPETDRLHRADTYTNGFSDGAAAVAAKIREQGNGNG